MLVHEIMTTPAYSIPEDASPAMALALMSSAKVSTLPVLDAGGDLVGVISEADLLRVPIESDARAHLRRGGHHGEAWPEHVSDLMTRMPEYVLADADVADVARMFAITGHKSVPVLRGRRLEGVVSRSDVVRALARPDSEVLHEVTREFARLGSVDWHVRVNGGVVEVEGVVSDRDRDLAMSLAVSVVGVRKVVFVPDPGELTT
jgi:CBS domain-containing protein